MENQNLYNIDEIINKCEEINDKNLFVKYVAEILKEKNYNYLYALYNIKFLKKEFIIQILKQTLNIMNEGGMNKKNQGENENEKEKRTTAGTFIYLVKNNDLITKELKSKIFWRNNKRRNSNRALNKGMSKLKIS